MTATGGPAKHGTRRAFAIWLLVGVTFITLPCFAQDQDGGVAHSVEAQAQAAMERGVAARDAGDLAAALDQFKQAQGLVPAANLPYRFAAEVEERLGQYAAAVQSYEAYLRAKSGVRDAEDVRRRIVELKARHLEGQLEVACEVGGVSIFDDGAQQPIATTPVLSPLTLPTGVHELRFVPTSGAPVVVTVDVRPGAQRVACGIDVPRVRPTVPTDVATAPPHVTPTELPPTSPLYMRPWFWGGAAFVVVGGVAAAYLATRPTAPDSDGGAHRFPER